jgi:predicted O-methyltransferase YrrM
MCNREPRLVYHAGVRPAPIRPSLLIVSMFVCFGCLGPAQKASPGPVRPTRSPYHFTGPDWFVGRITWPDLLAEYRDKPRVRYLEIGVFEGRSLLWMLDNVLTGPHATAVAVDLFQPEYEKTFLDNLKLSGKAEQVQIAKGRSDILLHRLPPGSFDIIFIDGSHAARDVMLDATQGWLLLSEGGLMIFDDYQNERPREEFAALPRVPDELKPHMAIDAFVTAFRDELEVVQRDFQMVVRKRAPSCHDWICSGGKSWYYNWSQRRLFRRATKENIPLSDEQRTHLETILTTLPLGATEPPEPSQECLAAPACKSVIDLLTAP